MTEPINDQFSVRETDSTFTLGEAWDASFRDRHSYDREKLLQQAVNAWRSNPLARRVIEMTTEFVLGDGFTWECRGAAARRALEEFWNHPLNALDDQLPEWADEAWRAGDLFVLFSVGQGGACYVRAVPAEQISAIDTAPNDYRQERAFLRRGGEPPYPAYDPDAGQEHFVLHFPLSRAAGALFGESDLYPILHWLGLYRNWLEDRARLNSHRQLFAYVVQKDFQSAEERLAYLNTFRNRLPAHTGGVIALDRSETLSVINPQLASGDAAEDGLALKRMIAVGAGIPLHYLAEPEESTRTTAESADMPAFRRFRQRQRYLRAAVRRVLGVALEVRQRRGGGPRLAAEGAALRVLAPDISERDNAALAMGVQRIVNAFAPLYNARLVEGGEFLRLVYRFLAEPPPAPGKAAGERFIPVNVRGGVREEK